MSCLDDGGAIFYLKRFAVDFKLKHQDASTLKKPLPAR